MNYTLYIVDAHKGVPRYYQVVGTVRALTRASRAHTHKEVPSSTVRCATWTHPTRKALRIGKVRTLLDIRSKWRSILRSVQDGTQQYQGVRSLARVLHPLGRRQVPESAWDTLPIDASRGVLTFSSPHIGV